MTDINKLAVSFKSIGKSSERKMTARLRRHAYESGWPVQLGRVLEVKHHDDGDFSIQYPAHLESEVLGIEWGSLDIPENPVMLRTSNRMDDLYDSHLSKINVALSEVKYI